MVQRLPGFFIYKGVVLIRKIIISMLLLFCMSVFTGCRGEPLVEQETELAKIKNVVSNFLNAEQNSNFTDMINFLTGEALAEVNTNLNRKQVQRKYLSIKLNEEIITSGLATVYADITAKYSAPSCNDRYALNFYLIQQNDRWLIYKVEPTAIERPLLFAREIPADAKKMLEDYFSMPYELKKYHELDYLAGQALNVSSQAYHRYRQNPPATTSKNYKVQEIESLGYSEEYYIAKVTYSGGNNNTTITAVVDMVDVDGKWKIARVDITRQERGH